MTPDAERDGCHAPLDPVGTLRFALFGPHDPTGRLEGGLLAKAWQTPEGPVTLALALDVDRWRAKAWGPGAGWAIARVAGLTGDHDDRAGWPSEDEAARALDARHRGLRLITLPWRADALVAIVLQQRVRFSDAARSWSKLLATVGDDAPGPLGLRTLPPWRRLQAMPAGTWQRWEVDAQRARTLHEVAWLARAIDTGSADDAEAQIATRPGIGPWTRGMFAGHVLGDADACIPGDVHLPRLVHAWQGDPRPPTDASMLAHLEAYTPHRFRIVRMLIAQG